MKIVPACLQSTMIALVLLALKISCLCADDAHPPPKNFESSVAPLLIRHCVSCHNSSDPKGGLDLTQAKTALTGGESGAAIVRHEPEQSLLVERIAEGSMPPPGKGKRLTPDEVAVVSGWIKAGADWPAGRTLSPFELTTEQRAGYDWWSLQPVRRPPLPAVRLRDWVRTPIDAFIADRLERRNLEPAPEADRATYVRRVTFDLLGLPPDPPDIDAFVQDSSPDAYERLVDRLLASPRYGERWGRHWLDVVRFGESDGFENDKLRSESWQFRDYVIRSFNADKPYRDFVREQLAGDVLSPVTREGIAASGFLVAGPWDEVQNVGKSAAEKLRAREEQLEELVSAVGQAFLGLTVHCSRCHDHKFDPIAQTDYYRIKAVFEGVEHGNRPWLTPDEQRAHDALVQPIVARVTELRKEIEGLRPVDGTAVVDRIPKDAFVDGRFGATFDPQKIELTLRSKPIWSMPPWTIECWARINSKGSFNILVANNLKESSEHWELYTYAGTGDLSLYLPGFAPAEIRSGVDIADGQWHYVAATLDGTTAALFVDGKQVVATPVKRLRTDGPRGSLSFGSYPPQKIGCDGLVDEVRLSNVVRPIVRVPEGVFAPDAETTGLWRFNRGEGERIRDFAPSASGKGDGETERGGDKENETRLKALKDELKQCEGELAAHPSPMVYAGVRKQPVATVLFQRGDIRKPGDPVAPGALTAVRALAADLGLPSEPSEGERRLRFADWVADRRNPLTARVLVNRIWQYHFGQGLVEMPSDFGFNGGLPSHPELLDWLAAEFVGDGEQGHGSGGDGNAWTLKRLHRLIVLSATYRQSSQLNPQAAAIDADNRLLWRFAPRRLEAETIRDAMLAVSGELNPQMGGPSFRPFTVTSILTQFYHLVDDGRPEFNRRTVYRINVNTAKSPFLDAFDCPAPSLAAPKRRSTTTTLQALALMNDSFVGRQAAKFAERVALAKTQAAARYDEVEGAFHMAFGRGPTDDERAATRRLIDEHGLESACWALLNASEFLYVK